MEVRRAARGFSLIEVLIASAIFLVLALGILPLFTQAMSANLAGRDATEVTNFAKSRIEELLQVPLTALVVPAGSKVGETQEYWSKSAADWKAGPAPTLGLGYAPDVVWLRTTRVRQYSRMDLMDNGFADTPLSGDTPANQVFFKEVEVEVRRAQSVFLGGGKSLRVRVLRAV